MIDYFTLDNFCLNDKIVSIRLDTKLPIIDGKILKTKQFLGSLKTLKELVKKGSKILILGHQSQKKNGQKKEISLENHLQIIEDEIKSEITFLKKFDRKNIEKALEKNQIILLENINFLEDKSAFLDTIEIISDYFILEGFSLIHANDPSITKNFKIPIIAGRGLERDFSHLSKITKIKSPRLYIFGGNKIQRTLEFIKYSLENKEVDKILLTGLIGEMGLISRGYNLGKKKELLEEFSQLEFLEDFKELLEKYPQEIQLPIDVAIYDKKEEKRVEIDVRDLDLHKELVGKFEILDIGIKTVNLFEQIISESNSIYFKGPAGKFEDENFEKGSKELMRAITISNAFTFMGGGHSSLAAKMFNMDKQFSYVSHAGSTISDFLQQKPLPGLINLQTSFQKYNSGENDFIIIGSNTMDIKTDVPEKLSEMEMGSKIKLDNDLKFQTGGGGVNVSITMSKFDSKIGYLGKISKENKELLLKTLEKHSINLIKSKETSQACAKSVLLQTKDNDRVILTFRGHNSSFSEEDINYDDLKSNNFYFTSLNDDAFKAEVKIAKEIKKRNSDAKICFNPSLYAIKSESSIKDLIKISDILIFNFDEAKELTQKRTMDECLEKTYAMGAKVVVITDGIQGTYAYNGKRQYFQKAKEAKKVVDTTGAGDCFSATFFYFYAKGYGTRSSLLYAASNAASLITKNGTENGLLGYNDLIKKKIV